MTARIPTHELVGLLTDLSLTAADPALGSTTASVLLHTVRGHIGDEPGHTDLLVGTSTDSHTVGHTHTACSGQIEPMLWPIAAVRDVIAVLKPKAKDKDHAVEIGREDDTVYLAEDADLFGEGMRFEFAGLDAADYPMAGIRQLLTEIHTRPAGEDVPDAAARLDFVGSLFAPFLRVASRRNEIVQTYRYHQRLPMSIQIGPHYRGVLIPFRWNDEDRDTGTAPSGDVYPPEAVSAE